MHWLFGRGASIACNLTWVVPDDWATYGRDRKVTLVKDAIRSEMDKPYIDTGVYRQFLELLAEHTANGWRHRFVTTNWDYLLQREIEALQLQVLPPWLANSHVYHVNGTVECLPDSSHRSPFLLEDDAPEQREFTPEANIVYNFMIWDTLFVVIGMSFECETDRFLLTALNRVEDDLPIGGSRWVVVNLDPTALEVSSTRIQRVLPGSTVERVRQTFGDWMEEGIPELQQRGVLTF